MILESEATCGIGVRHVVSIFNFSLVLKLSNKKVRKIRDLKRVTSHYGRSITTLHEGKLGLPVCSLCNSLINQRKKSP